MKSTIKYVSAMTLSMWAMWGNALEIKGSSITQGATQISNKPNMVFIFTDDIKSSVVVLKDSNNKNISLRKYQQNNTVSVVPRKGLKDTQDYTLSMNVKGDNDVLTKTLNFTIGKGDRNSPVINSSSSVKIDENQNEVMTISASDENKIVYALVNSRDAPSFNLEPNSGKLNLIDNADYEKKRTFVIKVSATDIKGNSTSSNITVRIIDLDEVAPVIKSPSSVSVNENQTSVMKIIATDKSALTYSLSGSDASSFNLDSNGVLNFKTEPDFEIKNSYSITITAIDEAKNSASKNIAILIKDLDDTAPVFTSPSSVSVNEKQKNVMNIKASDQSRVKYSLSGSDASSFNLNAGNGRLKFKTAPTYAIKNSYSIIVTATDRYKNSASQTINILINKTGEKENKDTTAPVFTSSSIISVDENQASVLTVKATDENKVAYSLSGSDASSFNLNSISGELSFKVEPDYETKSSYFIIITARDSEANSSSQNLIVNINDVEEKEEEEENNPPIANAGTDKTIAVDETITIIGSGSDTDGSISKYEWRKGNTLLTNSASFDYTPDVVGTDILTLTVTDNDGITHTDSMKVIVTKEITEICTPDTSLTGGFFTDSVKDTASIDVLAKYDESVTPDDTKPSKNYTQKEYRDLLGELTPIHGNLHNLAFKHYVVDFKKYKWPEAAHLILRYIQANGRNSIFVGYDGVSGEGMHYHFVWLAGLEALVAVLDGYKDPDGWNPPAGVKKITEALTHDTIMPPSDRWDSMITSPVMLTLPDGTDSGSHDSALLYFDPTDPTLTSSWPAGDLHYGYGIEKIANSYLLGAYGQLGLGDGKLDDQKLQVQSLLHFSPRDRWNGHAHNDTLMMGLFGQGRNLLSFPGHQQQTQNPENKNMVIIDSTKQNKYKSDLAGRVELFTPLPGIQISRVDASHISHKNSIQRYRRTLIQNTIDIEKAYLLDIFEAIGGETHDYMMRGSGVLEQGLPTTNLTTKNGSSPILDSKAAKFKNTKKASYDVAQSFWIDFNFKDKPELGTRSHFPAQGESGEIYLNGMEEQWTYAVNSNRDTSKYYKSLGSLIPQYTIHRSGAAPLESTFVTVHEVLDGSGNSFIKSVSKEPLDDSSIAVKVELINGRVDTYLVSFNGKKNMSYDELNADAIIAASSSFNGKSDLWMVGGNSVNNPLRILTSLTSEVTGTVSAVNRKENGASSNSFDTDMILPLDYELANQTILLENFVNGELIYTNSYTIKNIEEKCGKTRIHLNFDPGVEIGDDKVRELHHPRREASNAKLKFVFSATTVPYIANVSPGKDPMQRINPQVAHAIDTDENVQVSTVPINETVTYTLDSQYTQTSTNGAIYVDNSENVTMHVKNSDGFVNSRVINEKYYKPQDAINADEGAIGLLAKKYKGELYNLGNLDTYKISETTQVVKGLSFTQVPLTGNNGGTIVEGYIKIPTTGLYRFFTRMDVGVQLKIDDKVLVKDPGMRRVAQWVGEIYLEKGLHKIHVDNYIKEEEHFSVMWEGPEIPYGEIPENVLFQDIN